MLFDIQKTSELVCSATQWIVFLRILQGFLQFTKKILNIVPVTDAFFGIRLIFARTYQGR